MRFQLRGLTAAVLGAWLCSLAAAPAGAQETPQRDVFFGQTHVHTSWSLDAYIIGNTVTGPEDAYKYAIGEPIKHPAGYKVKITRPLDFQGVTDHSEYMGMVKLVNTPGSAISKLPIAEKLKVRNSGDAVKIFQWLAGTIARNEPIKELTSPEVAGSVWTETIAIANKYRASGREREIRRHKRTRHSLIC